MVGTCDYCGIPAAHNKQGVWGPACSGCKGSLTRMLRSGRYGSPYAGNTKRRLRTARYDWISNQWIVPTNASQ